MSSDETVEKRCMLCKATSEQRILLCARQGEKEVWVCVGCLPMLIHGAH